MINARFYQKKGLYCGFVISGHAGGRFGQDIVCAGVSSAVMLTINTMTDFLVSDCTVRIEKNVAALKLNDYKDNIDCRALIFSLKTHLQLLNEENGGINIIIKNI